MPKFTLQAAGLGLQSVHYLESPHLSTPPSQQTGCQVILTQICRSSHSTSIVLFEFPIWPHCGFTCLQQPTLNIAQNYLQEFTDCVCSTWSKWWFSPQISESILIKISSQKLSVILRQYKVRFFLRMCLESIARGPAVYIRSLSSSAFCSSLPFFFFSACFPTSSCQQVR